MLYYESRIERRDQEFLTVLCAAMAEEPCYGYERLAIKLDVNDKKVQRVKQKFDLYPLRSKRMPRKARDRGLEPTQPNLIKNLVVLAPRTVYAGDFTYIKFQGSFVYLATVIDLFNREIVGWSIGTRHTARLVTAALEDAIRRTGTNPSIIHHDCGSEYLSKRYKRTLEAHQIRLSLSRKGAPWENGCQESYYAGLKEDMNEPDNFDDLGELIEEINLTINYYNKTRIHTALKMSPVEYFKRYENQKDKPSDKYILLKQA